MPSKNHELLLGSLSWVFVFRPVFGVGGWGLVVLSLDGVLLEWSVFSVCGSCGAGDRQARILLSTCQPCNQPIPSGCSAYHSICPIVGGNMAAHVEQLQRHSRNSGCGSARTLFLVPTASVALAPCRRGFGHVMLHGTGTGCCKRPQAGRRHDPGVL